MITIRGMNLELLRHLENKTFENGINAITKTEMTKPQNSINENTQRHNTCESILIIPTQKRAAIYICTFSSRNKKSIISRQLQAAYGLFRTRDGFIQTCM